MQEKKKAFSLAAIALIKGIVYRAEEPIVWEGLNKHLAELEDYFESIGLEVYLDDTGGYAYLKQGESELPKLARRQSLSFKVSFLLALLRAELARREDESEGDVVVSAEEIAERFMLYLPEHNDEARAQREIDTALSKAVELGFLKRLGDGGYKIQPVLKSFVDASWLAEFDKKMAEYEKLMREKGL